MVKISDLVLPQVKYLTPYNAGLTINEVREKYAPERFAKLGSNENPLGPTPDLSSLLGEGNDVFRLYPDPSGKALCELLTKEFELSEGRVILGNGSEDLLSVICRAVIRPGDRVVTLYPSFPLHEDYATVMGGKIERINIREDFTIDADAFRDAVGKPARLVIFSNPMNPVGSWISPKDLKKIINALHPDTLFVVDEAYAEYAAGDDYPSAASLLEDTEQPWIALRTFSKAYGLAGLRIGFGIISHPELRSYLDRVRTPFNTNAIAQAAAILARADLDHLAKSINHAIAERERMRTQLMAQGFVVAPSKGNFLFFNCGRNASEMAEDLLRHGVIVKPWKQPGYETFLRVSIGAQIENDQFIEAMYQVT